MADIKTYLNQILNAVYGKDVRQAIHDAIHQCYEDGQSGSSDLIAREGIEEIKTSIANPNLLINGDFRNPVNQRGETSYAPTGNYACYTVDRWFIFPSLNDGSGHSLTVNNGYITFANTNANMSAFMAQYLEKPLSGKFTITVKVISTTKTLALTYKDGGTFHTAMTLNEGVNTATIECASLDCIRMNMTSEASADIEYIKLEYGSVATPYVPRSYAEELLLCLRYYQKLKYFRTLWTSDINNVWVDSISLSIPMRTCPTLTYNAYDSFNVSSFKIATNQDQDNLSIQAQYTLSNSSGNGHRIGAFIYCDSEIY